jgi:hypothetical protein
MSVQDLEATLERTVMKRVALRKLPAPILLCIPRRVGLFWPFFHYGAQRVLHITSVAV